MSQWAEIRHLHLVEGVAKKQIARRLQLDIKTVRRAVEQPRLPVRASSPRVRSLDPWREQIAQWLDQDRRLTAKRIRRLLLPLAGPVAAVESWAALNALLITELEADLPARHLDDGRPVQDAWRLERQHLRALPVHRPATCRIVARVADKFGHVRVDHITYSVPTRHAYRPVWVKLYHDRVAVAVGAEVVAQHPRAFRRGAKVLDARHVLPLLERKHRAVPEATALRSWRLAPVWQQVRAALAKHTRKPDQEWVRMLRLMETHPAAAVERAVAVALERHSPRLETVRLILRQQQAGPPAVCRPVDGVRPDLARIDVPTPTLAAYDALVRTC